MGDKLPKLQPRGDTLLIRLHEEKDQTTNSGVVIPGKLANVGFKYATVLDKGPGHYLENGSRATITEADIGDVVFVMAVKTIPLKVDDTELCLIREDDVYARIRKGD